MALIISAKMSQDVKMCSVEPIGLCRLVSSRVFFPAQILRAALSQSNSSIGVEFKFCKCGPPTHQIWLMSLNIVLAGKSDSVGIG